MEKLPYSESYNKGKYDHGEKLIGALRAEGFDEKEFANEKQFTSFIKYLEEKLVLLREDAHAQAIEHEEEHVKLQNKVKEAIENLEKFQKNELEMTQGKE